MPRTTEQTAADDALTEAIRNVQVAYFGDDWRGVITDYVVVFNEARFDDDGDREDAVSVCVKDNSQAVHQTLGLLDFAQTRQRWSISGGGQYEEDDD